MELCKGVHRVDLGERFQTHIYMQNSTSIQPSTSRVKFARIIITDPPLLLLQISQVDPPGAAAGAADDAQEQAKDAEKNGLPDDGRGTYVKIKSKIKWISSILASSHAKIELKSRNFE